MSLRDAIGSAIRAIGQGLRGILTDEVEAVEAYGQMAGWHRSNTASPST